MRHRSQAFRTRHLSSFGKDLVAVEGLEEGFAQTSHQWVVHRHSQICMNTITSAVFRNIIMKLHQPTPSIQLCCQMLHLLQELVRKRKSDSQGR